MGESPAGGLVNFEPVISDFPGFTVSPRFAMLRLNVDHTDDGWLESDWKRRSELMSTAGSPTQALTLDSRVVPADELLSSELDGEAVILDLTSGVYFGLNGVGARIWELLGEARDLR